MGYRKLLKCYIRHLELVAGDNFIEQKNTEPVLRKRDLSELRTLAAEIRREGYGAAEASQTDGESQAGDQRNPTRHAIERVDV